VHIVEFGAGTLRFLDQLPPRAPRDGFIWIYLEREQLEQACPCCSAPPRAWAAPRCWTCT